MPPERLMLLLAIVCCPPAVAAAPTQTPDDSRDGGGRAAPGAAADNGARTREPEVSIELLEFLGGWETATGPWNETMPDSERAPPVRRPKETARD